MEKVTMKEITREEIPAITDLLIERQKIERESFPDLLNPNPNRAKTRKTLEKLFDSGKVIGAAGFQNGELLGFLLGRVMVDTRNGRYVSVPYEGMAIREDQSFELLRELYTHASPLWLEQGCFNHSVLVPLGNPVYYEGFQQLSFAIEQVHALMRIQDYKPFQNLPDLNVRIAEKKDSEALACMSGIITQCQNAAPSFVPAYPEVVEMIREGFRGLAEEENDIVLIAEKYGEVLGFHDYEIIDSDLMIPDGGIGLDVAGTCQSWRGKGVGKNLVNEGCRVLKEKGFSTIKTDWRITNLSSSRFWPKCGFKPVAYRMARSLDEHIAWAIYKGTEGDLNPSS